MTNELELLRGTLDLFILKTLTWQPMHGLGILRWIEQTSDFSLQIEEGALYPALHRLEIKGWLSAEWGQTEQNRRAKFYALTPQGRQRLASQTALWKRYVSAADLILSASRGTA